MNVAALNFVRGMVVFDDLFISDHFPILLSLYSTDFSVNSNSWYLSAPLKRLVWSPDRGEEFTLRLERSLNEQLPSHLEGVEEKDEFLKRTIFECAKDVGMLIISKGNDVDSNSKKLRGGGNVNMNKKWIDQEVLQIKSKTNKAWRLYKRNKKNNDKSSDDVLLDEYHTLKKQFKKIVNNKKKMYFEEVRWYTGLCDQIGIGSEEFGG